MVRVRKLKEEGVVMVAKMEDVTGGGAREERRRVREVRREGGHYSYVVKIKSPNYSKVFQEPKT